MIMTPSCKQHSLTSPIRFFDGEPDVAPPAPFVMRCALRVAPAGSLVMRVCFHDEFYKRGVHLDVVRYEQSGVAQAGPELSKLPKHVPVTMRAIVQKHV